MQQFRNQILTAVSLGVLGLSWVLYQAIPSVEELKPSSMHDPILDGIVDGVLTRIEDGSRQEVSIKALHSNKVTVLHFWAPWCGPCVQELPEFDEFAANFKEEFTIIGVANDHTDGVDAQKIYQQRNIRALPLHIDKDGELARKYKIKGYPTTVFIDAKGNEVGRIQSVAEWSGEHGQQLVAYLSRL